MENRATHAGKCDSTAPDGVDFKLGTQQAAILTAHADWRISQTDTHVVHTRALRTPKATVGYQSAPHIQAASFMRHH